MKLICINCPKGCELDVRLKEGGEHAAAQSSSSDCRHSPADVVVTGHTCPRGEAYGKAELLNPTRMVTGLVRVAGMRKPLPVKTRVAIPKGKIDAVLFALHQTTVQLPVKIGDVIIAQAAGTGVDVVATANRG